MISSDLPIKKTEEDLLNRGSFAQNLAQVLMQYSFSSSFTIGLYGKWGSGKTSLLNMVFEIVESSDQNAVILRFNPWLCSDPKQMITQFFKQLAAAIKLKKSASDQAWMLIDQYADIFDAASLIPVAGTYISKAGKILAAKAKEQVERQTNDLQQNKNKIIEKMTEENLRIIVSIDDIDRLSDEEIAAVFQLVKALADFPNTIYLLAFDYDVVVHALGKVQYGDGREYLEKVIQVPFEIPAPSMSSIHEALISKLDAILGDIPEERWDRATWAKLFRYGIQDYIRSIRDVIRYTNVFFLKYPLLKDETDPVDLLGLTCLQVFEPTIYSKLSHYKDTLCGANSAYSQTSKKSDEKKVQATIDALFSDSKMIANVEAAKKILGILFPRTRDVTNVSYSMGRYYSHRHFLVNNNIATSECFDRYFSLTLGNDDIPTTTIKQMIYEADESTFTRQTMQIYEEGKIIRLLDAIEAYANKDVSLAIPSERASLIIRCLARQWSYFEVDDRAAASIPFPWRFLYCVDALLEYIDAASRYSCVREVFEDNAVQPSTLALWLNDLEVQHGRFTEEESGGDKQAITLDEVMELEQIFKKRAVEALDSGSALKHYGGLNFLGMLGKIDAELVVDKKQALVSDDVSLVKILSYCTSHGTVTAGGVVTKIRSVNQKDIRKFIDENEAYQRIRAFVVTDQFLSLSKDEQMDTMAFLLMKERQAENGIMRSDIPEETIQKELQNMIDKNPNK